MQWSNVEFKIRRYKWCIWYNIQNAEEYYVYYRIIDWCVYIHLYFDPYFVHYKKKAKQIDYWFCYGINRIKYILYNTFLKNIFGGVLNDILRKFYNIFVWQKINLNQFNYDQSIINDIEIYNNINTLLTYIGIFLTIYYIVHCSIQMVANSLNILPIIYRKTIN